MKIVGGIRINKLSNILLLRIRNICLKSDRIFFNIHGVVSSFSCQLYESIANSVLGVGIGILDVGYF